jgi:hypothetical protein
MLNARDVDAESSQLSAFKKAIRAKYDLKETAFADRDVELLVSHFYAEDAIEVGDGDPVQIGRDALRREYQRHISDRVRIESYSTHVEGNSGWDWVNFYVTPGESAVAPFIFVILFLWERRDGEWWCVGGSYSRAAFTDSARRPSAL